MGKGKKKWFAAGGMFVLALCAAIVVFAETQKAPTPYTGYPPRGKSMTEGWNAAGTGYYDPDTYKPPSVPEADGKDNCIECHAKITPRAVEDFKNSKMGKSGAVDCSTCHGKHPNIKMPTPETCAPCHKEKVDQANAGKHGRYAWKGHEKAGRRLAQIEEMKEAGCGSCHNVGKKCDSCHTRHSFNPEEARKPEACGTCHMGPDHAQYEYYESSKHGVIYSIEGKSFEQGGRAPVCATCHFSKGDHNVSNGITIAGSSQGKWIGDKNSGDAYVKNPDGITMNEITAEDYTREREKMLSICTQCHSRRFAEHKLQTADGIKLEADSVVGEALKVLTGLYKDGLLNPMPKDRPENPFAAAKGNNGDDMGIWLTGHQLYEQTSGIEAKFFRMYKFDNVHTWKGAFHFSPDWTHWYGNAPLKLSLSEIIGEANMIRRINALEVKAGIKPEMPKIPENTDK